MNHMNRQTLMKLFKTFTLKWWQTSIFKIGMLALGIVIGAYLHNFFGGYLVILIIVSALSLAYVTYIWWKQ
jgi:ABC-type arginine transport system permease subunit